MMQGVSRESLAEAQRRLERSLGQGEAGTAASVAEDLAAVIGLLDREISLRRVLTDPAASGDRKSGLVRSLLEGRVGNEALGVVAEAAAAPWSRTRDLADAIETLSVLASVIEAEHGGYLDDLEDALFRFGRVVGGNPELRGVLADRTVPAERKAGLIRTLLEGKVRPATMRLIEQAVTHPRGRTLDVVLEEYAGLAAAYRRRLIALVRVARPLTDEQRQRLAGALQRIYGHEVQLNIVVDADVVGGICVQVGDEVVDGTVAARLDEAKRRLAG
jgi:F-type H+-transporting ATPase subunit delta